MTDKLEQICRKFITDNKISCEEAIYQCDWVGENAYEFIQEICDCIGYMEDEE